MKKINLSLIDRPIKIKQKKFFDKRGYFQEVYLNKKLGLNLNLAKRLTEKQKEEIELK